MISSSVIATGTGPHCGALMNPGVSVEKLKSDGIGEKRSLVGNMRSGVNEFNQ